MCGGPALAVSRRRAEELSQVTMVASRLAPKDRTEVAKRWGHVEQSPPIRSHRPENPTLGDRGIVLGYVKWGSGAGVVLAAIPATAVGLWRWVFSHHYSDCT